MHPAWLSAFTGGISVGRLSPARMSQTPCYRPSAVLTSFTPSSLAHSAGPDSEAISHPFGSINSVVGMPIALPTALRSWKTLALVSE